MPSHIKAIPSAQCPVLGFGVPKIEPRPADFNHTKKSVDTSAYRELQGEGLLSVKHGSGAVVTSRQTRATSQEDLRKPLRAALTQMALAGLRRDIFPTAVK